jgi:HAD superfamily hydrolase (TIGR01509 family)
MNKFSRIAAICFDLDGVLVQITNIHHEAFNKTLEAFGYPVVSLEKFNSLEFKGLGSSIKFELLDIPKHLIPKMQEYKDEQTMLLTNLSPFAGEAEKIDMLNRLKSMGIKLACVTNSVEEYAIELLKKVKQHHLFDELITRKSVNQKKPNSECYEIAMKKLKVTPKNVLCVEDSSKGVLAAKTANIKYIWHVEHPSEVNFSNLEKFVCN